MSRYRTGQETLKGESEWHPSAEVCLASKSQFNTFGVPNGTLKVPNCHHVGFGLTAFE